MEQTTNETEAKKGFSLQGLGTGALIGIFVAALAIGVVVGKFALNGVGTGGALGKKALTDAELSNPVGTYTYGGKTEAITAREVIEQFGSLSSSKEAAYYVAYQAYSTKQSDASTKWTDFVNDLLVNASVSLNALVA